MSNRVGATLCFIAAVLFKQNEVGAALGIFAADVVCGKDRFRLRIVGPALFVVGSLGSYGLVDLRAAGALHHTFALIAGIDPKSLGTALSALHDLLVTGAVPLVLSIVALARMPTSTAVRVAGALVGACAVAAVGVSKGGAMPSYFATTVWIAASSAAVGFSLFRPSEASTRVATLAALAIVVLPTRVFLSETKQRLLSPYRHSDELALLASLPSGPIISETPELAVRSGRPVWIDDPYAATLAFNSGYADPAGLDRALVEGDVKIVVRNRLPYPLAKSYLFRNGGKFSRRFDDLLERCFDRVAETTDFEIRRYAGRCRVDPVSEERIQVP